MCKDIMQTQSYWRTQIDVKAERMLTPAKSQGLQQVTKEVMSHQVWSVKKKNLEHVFMCETVS